MTNGKVEEIMDKCTKELWPILAFVSGSIIENVKIGSFVKVSSDHGSHEGFVLGMTSIKTGHIKVSSIIFLGPQAFAYIFGSTLHKYSYYFGDRMGIGYLM